ncbi:MAG: hypothetical protein PHE01_11075 [Methanosarcina sp.]|nr:hypothetical protein [Methanosarcina sp.]
MLAVALNYVGGIEEKGFGPIFVKRFNDFKVIKISPYEELKKGQLQLCQPVEYEELIKGIQEHWDPSGTFLELRGFKDKLQRAIRQMCFFDEEKKFEKVLLEGSDGITDFPWALQIVLVQLPAPGWEQDMEWIRKADILILNNSVEESRNFIDQAKIIRPDVPIFIEKIQEGLSDEMKSSLESLFTTYLEKRKRVKAMLEENLSDQVINCEQAHRMAAKLRVDLYLFGNVCDECGYSITRCRLGCF